jgi:phosphoglycerol transferase
MMESEEMSFGSVSCVVSMQKTLRGCVLKIKSNLSSEIRKNFLIFAVCLTIVFAALLFRNWDIYPTVFADEYIYSKFSRLLPLSDSTIPGYVYLAIYSITNTCGDGFLSCARILNALFFVAAAPFIYLTARRVCTGGIASVIAFLALLGPINSYTAYYMPEALYFFSFWLFTWFVLQLDNSSDSMAWSLGGILLGLSALVKPHSLFFLPAVLIYILYVSRKNGGDWILQAFRNAFFFIAFVFLTKLLFGYFLAGKSGITIFGPMYSSVASSTTSNFQRYLELFNVSAEILKGHVLAISLMFGMPIAFAINSSFNMINSKAEVKTDQKITFYTLAILASLILVTCLFTASVANTGPYETAARLHMRYYNFMLPLLLIIATSQLSLEPINGTLKWRAIAAFPIGATILYAVYTHLMPYTPSLVDSPELRGFTSNSTVFHVLSGISFVALAVWGYDARAGAKFFIYLFMPLSVFFSTTYVNQELRQRLIPDVYDKAGIFAKQHLSNEEISKLLIVGSDLSGLFRSLFYLDSTQASFEVIPEGTSYELSKIPVGKEWVLAIGDHLLRKEMSLQFPMNGFTLDRIVIVDFKKSSWPGVITKSRGLCSAEGWGRWSAGETVTLEFAMPLPEKFAIQLVARAFGPNVGKEFMVHVGGITKNFKLNASHERRVIEFVNSQKDKTIKFDIPSPASPKDLGLSADERKLGIAFTELRIVPL